MNESDSIFKLCKEVYERTDWEAGDWYYERTDPKSTVSLKTLGRPDIGFHVDEYDQLTPLYTSDYLLEKLPGRIHSGHYSLDLRLSKVDNEYDFAYMDRHLGFHYEGISDTPLKALLKLVLALDEAGVKL